MGHRAEHESHAREIDPLIYFLLFVTESLFILKMETKLASQFQEFSSEQCKVFPARCGHARGQGTLKARC